MRVACPSCLGEDAAEREGRNFDPLYGTVEIYCTYCGSFVDMMWRWQTDDAIWQKFKEQAKFGCSSGQEERREPSGLRKQRWLIG
jgi:hypothetical protein